MYIESIENIENMVKEIEGKAQISLYLEQLKKHSMMMYEHDKRVCYRAIKMAINRNLPKSEIIEIGLAGRLINVGYLKIPKNCIEKKCITKEDFKILKSHVFKSVSIAQEMGLSETIQDMIKTHHERIDGSGYPEQLTTKLEERNKIIALADTYEALIEDRPYRKAYDMVKAIRMIYNLQGSEFSSETIACLIQTLFV